ncbi:hypothetical protein H2200_011517 [Cladophialophora chaetospira]|uniref:Uncharacterized protein n=1 Tax=Cladophialophora chaetospira TaxID=386627 RepID=A0AA39CD74_9EURO|nr:hypothetical protein H2200_011517 [Cladophialophora chaetospira]
MAALMSDSELFWFGAALAAKANEPQAAARFKELAKGAASKPAAMATGEATKTTAYQPAAMATADSAKAYPPIDPVVSSTPAGYTSIIDLRSTPIASAVTKPAPSPAQPWNPKNRSLCDVDDPFVCPGLNRDCFHATITDAGYWAHVSRKHGYTRYQLDDDANEAARDIFVPPRRASFFTNRGIDITYQGDEPKQVAARKRMAMGMRSTDPGYVKAVYGSIPTETPDVKVKSK